MVGGTKTVRFRVSGKVQGVGFRWYTRKEARELGVLGRVRNLPDGHVEVVATGSDEQLDTLRRKLLEGPPGAHVTGLDEQEQHGVPVPEGFEIDR